MPDLSRHGTKMENSRLWTVQIASSFTEIRHTVSESHFENLIFAILEAVTVTLVVYWLVNLYSILVYIEHNEDKSPKDCQSDGWRRRKFSRMTSLRLLKTYRVFREADCLLLQGLKCLFWNCSDPEYADSKLLRNVSIYRVIKIIVGILTTCHTQYISDTSM